MCRSRVEYLLLCLPRWTMVLASLRNTPVQPGLLLVMRKVPREGTAVYNSSSVRIVLPGAGAPPFLLAASIPLAWKTSSKCWYISTSLEIHEEGRDLISLQAYTTILERNSLDFQLRLYTTTKGIRQKDAAVFTTTTTTRMCHHFFLMRSRTPCCSAGVNQSPARKSSSNHSLLLVSSSSSSSST